MVSHQAGGSVNIKGVEGRLPNNPRPLVSIIMPTYNEQTELSNAVVSLMNQTYSHWELLIYNGGSVKWPDMGEKVKVIPNPKRWPVFAYIEGPKMANGEYVMLASAHATYEPDYIEKCLETIQSQTADCVGGVIIPDSCDKTAEALAIARVLGSKLGSAGSTFRTGADRIRETDTVGFGFYPRFIFEKHQFNEKLLRSSDMAFHKELKRAGCRIILNPKIKAHYHPSANLKDFAAHCFSDGYWITKPLWSGIVAGNLRHYLPLLGLAAFPVTLPLWLMLMIGSSKEEIKAYFCRHWVYAAGSLKGLVIG